MSEATPRWITKTLLLAIHGRLLAEHGGAIGLRDEGLLESALASPRNRFEYGETDVFELAAAYAFALTSNHPFVDGNKRTALAAAITFLAINDVHVAAEPDELWAFLDHHYTNNSLDFAVLDAWLRVHTCAKGD